MLTTVVDPRRTSPGAHAAAQIAHSVDRARRVRRALHAHLLEGGVGRAARRLQAAVVGGVANGLPLLGHRGGVELEDAASDEASDEPSSLDVVSVSSFARISLRRFSEASISRISSTILLSRVSTLSLVVSLFFL